jgi:hypothetical protein
LVEQQPSKQEWASLLTARQAIFGDLLAWLSDAEVSQWMGKRMRFSG